MIRILLAQPSRLVCDTLRAALESVGGVYVVGCATNAEELRFFLPQANVVLLGKDLEDASAFEILEEIRAHHPDIKLLVMGVDERPEVIIRYVEAGADGYILQDESLEEMIEKLQAAHEEKAIVSPFVAAAMMERLSKLANMETPLAFAQARESKIEELTPREVEVLQLIDQGCTNQNIANELVIERGTVKNHVHNILSKLEVSSRHEAATIFQLHSQSSMSAV